MGEEHLNLRPNIEALVRELLRPVEARVRELEQTVLILQEFVKRHQEAIVGLQPVGA